MRIFFERVLIWDVESISLVPCRSFGKVAGFASLPFLMSILILALTGFDNLD